MADSRTVTVRLQPLNEHLGCVLCRGMLRDAHTIPECLHSFCKSCIFRYFLLQCDPNEPSCPKCHTRLSARPIATLISDQRLQDVVDRIFPEHKERDAVLEQQFYRRHAFAKKRVVALATASNGVTDMNNPNTTAAPTTSLWHDGARNSVATLRPFTIEVYPDASTRVLPALRRPFLHVDGRFKMAELRKVVAKWLDVVVDELEVTCLGAIVGPELSVLFIHRTVWQPQHDSKRLVLQYRHVAA